MHWDSNKINDIVIKQRNFFRTGKTLDLGFRIDNLHKLKNMIVRYENEMIDALNKDLGRCKEEAYFCDIGTIILECNEMIHNIKKWAKPELHFSGLICFPSIFTKVYKVPYGVSLIFGSYNFPFLLTLGVLIDSIAGGNTTVIKTSSKTNACTELLKKMINECFSNEYIVVIDGDNDVSDMCLDERFDKIFYTGSPRVAKHILEKASISLTPVTLELGGETGNWCIVRKDADIKDAARKIAFMKICNSGQICININQVAVAKEIADEFVNELKNAIIKQIGEKPYENDEYSKLIDISAYKRCESEVEINRDKVVFGGVGDEKSLKYSPTILYPISIDDDIVKHELFCPILPIVKFDDTEIDSLLNIIESREHGLALYLFTKDTIWAEKIMSTMQYGGGCINEVCLHLVVKGVPFNGVGHSGMGSYHGEWGFREFTHPSTVLKGNNHFNLSLREHPFKNKKYKFQLIKFFEK